MLTRVRDLHRAVVRALALCAAVSAVATVCFAWNPVFSLAFAIAAWAVALGRRLGLAATVSVIAIAWMLVVLATIAFAAALDLPFTLGLPLVYGLAATLVLVMPTERRATTEVPAGTLPRWGIAAACIGPALWLFGLALAAYAPRGAGLSWAAYSDSSLDVWAIRRIAVTEGDGLVAWSNPRPLEHALSAGFLPRGHVPDASATAVREDLVAHAAHWSLTIMAASFLAGVVVLELTRRSPLPARLLAVSATSGAALLMPVTGRILDQGQINAPLVWVLVFASTLIALRARDQPHIASASLLVATGLLALTWTPFAAVPGVLAILVVAIHRQWIFDHSRRLGLVAWWGIATISFAWMMSTWALESLLRLAQNAEASGDRVRTETALGTTNLHWLPLYLVLALVIAVLAVDRRRSAGPEAGVSVAVVSATLVGFAPFALALGSLGEPFAYYPAKYVSLATVCLVPLAIGMIVDSASRNQGRGRVLAATSTAALVTLLMVAPLPGGVPRWGFVPWYLATGEHFGTHEQLAGRILALTNNDTRDVAWRLEEPFDYHVNWMLSVIDPIPYEPWGSPARAPLRNFGPDYSAARACELDRAHDRVVTLVTRDPELEASVAVLCDAGSIVVTLEDDYSEIAP